MKQLLLAILILLTFSGFAQSGLTPEGKADSIRSVYTGLPLTGSAASELKAITIKIQNEGFTLEEQQHNYTRALQKTNSSIAIWEILRDTVNLANLLKYRGFLLGHLNKFEDAKKEIHTAILLFTQVKKDFGVAVSEFDLSKVYELQLKYDSSFYYARKAIAFWSAKKDTFRIVTISNQLLNLSCKTRDLAGAEKIQLVTESLLHGTPMHWRPVIDFYYLSYELYRLMGNFAREKIYYRLYDDKLRLLKEENIIVATSYSL